tara:strand:+ start:662 stop:961 length:300 start_codon:yes stop_codon:yes gene_type:complete
MLYKRDLLLFKIKNRKRNVLTLESEEGEVILTNLQFDMLFERYSTHVYCYKQPQIYEFMDEIQRIENDIKKTTHVLLKNGIGSIKKVDYKTFLEKYKKM